MKLSEIEDGTIFSAYGRIFELGGGRHDIIVNENNGGWKLCITEDDKKAAKFRGCKCYPKMGGKFQIQFATWLPDDTDIEVKYDTF